MLLILLRNSFLTAASDAAIASFNCKRNGVPARVPMFRKSDLVLQCCGKMAIVNRRKPYS